MKRLRKNRFPDSVDWQILSELQRNARVPFAELGRRVGLSAPAVTERVRRLEDAGIITGYHATVDLARIGRPIQAIIRLGNPGDRTERLLELIREMPEVLDCHTITGDESFVVRVAVRSVDHLEHLIRILEPYATTTTSLVLSSPVMRHEIGPLEVG
ncbi:MAG: Lrp/AsnC family transcriptional regulator [Anaerolineae bacterium]|nr:Lrp/AsnC family transcriptional regulator [Anaerolineae bacterium]